LVLRAGDVISFVDNSLGGERRVMRSSILRIWSPEELDQSALPQYPLKLEKLEWLIPPSQRVERESKTKNSGEHPLKDYTLVPGMAQGILTVDEVLRRMAEGDIDQLEKELVSGLANIGTPTRPNTRPRTRPSTRANTRASKRMKLAAEQKHQ
jgi:hypothetical protein